MKRLLLVLMIPFIIISCTSAKRISFLNVEELEAEKSVPVDLAKIEAEYGDFDGVYLNMEIIVEHSGIKEKTPYGLGDKWIFSYIYKAKYVVLDPENDYLTTVHLYTMPDNLFLRATSPDGVSKRYGRDDLIEEKDDDGYKQYKFAFPKVVKGTVVEFAYDYAHGVHPSFAGIYINHETLLQRSIPIQKLNYSFAYPGWWQVKVKKIGEKKGIPLQQRQDLANKKKILVYEKLNVPAIEKEPYSPSFKEVAQYIEIMITNMAVMGAVYEHPKTWAELAGRFKSYQLKKSDKQSDRLDETVDSVLSGNTHSKLEQVDALLEFVYGEISHGKSQKANYKNVLKKKEGNVYDITGLMKAMLAHAGIESSFLLVHNSKDGFFDRDFVSGEQLYVPAVWVKIENIDYVLFPYIKDLPLKHTPERFQGQTALVVADNVEASWFWKVPPGNRDNNALDEHYDITIDETGSIKVIEKRKMRGSLAYSFRKALADLAEQEIGETVKDLMTYTDGDIQLESYSILNLDEYKEHLEIEMTYSIENLVTVTPEEVLFQTGGLFSPISNTDTRIDANNRSNPIQIAYDEQYNKLINITYPANWKIATDLVNIEFVNKFGSLLGQYQKEEGKLTVTQQVNFNKIFAPKEDINDMAQLAGTQSQLNIPTIVFSIEPEI